PIHLGSCITCDKLPALQSLTFATWIWPTSLEVREECVVSRGNPRNSVGYALTLTQERQLSLRVASGRAIAQVVLPGIMPTRRWTFVAFVIDADGDIRIVRYLQNFTPDHPKRELRIGRIDGGFEEAGDQPLLIGASGLKSSGGSNRVEDAFNGKISTPLFFGTALTEEELDLLATGDSHMVSRALARWDFSARADTATVPDASDNGYDASTVNRPGRLVTGHNFSGRHLSPHLVPNEYNAVYLHDDDLADAGWAPSLQFTIPPGLASGIYGVKLTCDEQCDYVPFVVRTPPSRSAASVAILLPTVSYQAYANSSLDPSILPDSFTPLRDLSCCQAERAYVATNRLRSLYDTHSDGSGVAMATMLRPMLVNVRPNSRTAWNGSPHQLGADLHLIDWLEQRKIAYDVLTDHDVDREGVSALSRYSAVITGTHAEYWTGRMLDALEGYQNRGGRFVYLSGNGLYWVTALSDDQTLVEIRRVRGTRTWTAPPGEENLSLTGEPGGLWRDRGRAPQRYVGVGFAAQGFDRGCGYRRLPASYEPRASFIFRGVEDELIGDFPTLVAAHGAAGFEVDRADYQLGTPEHALILARASSLNDSYQAAIEEVGGTTSLYGGTTWPQVRAEMVFYETPNDGAVFSVGSISWCSALSYNNYDNNVSRTTENVIRAFASPGPLPRT